MSSLRAGCPEKIFLAVSMQKEKKETANGRE